MRTFKPYDLDQPYLLPPDLRSWLSEGHLALFVSDVVDALDLSTILDEYERGDGRGYPPDESGDWSPESGVDRSCSVSGLRTPDSGLS